MKNLNHKKNIKITSNRQEIGPFDYIELFKRNTSLIVTMDKSGKLNIMALDWKKMEEIDGKAVIRAQIAYSRYTYTLLTEGINEFTINIPPNEMYHVIDIAGSYSGRNIDKLKKTGLETIPGQKVKVPTIKDSILSYECKIIKDSKSDISSHHYFYGEILAACASNEISK